VLVRGVDVKEDVDSVRKQIGYCPQFDALLDLMTVREHLELYARIKGYRGESLSEEVDSKISMMHLEEFEDSRAAQLSGGNKRKLSFAIAVTGEPDIVFLDEPSAGMDPGARRFMWSMIRGIASMRPTSAVILTTHAMDEADALCSRIAIQCSGQLRCLGTAQQLKEWYSTGLELNVRLNVPTSIEVEKVCKAWDGYVEKELNAKGAEKLVEEYYKDQVLKPSSAPLSGHMDSILMGALAEWCLLQDRADGVEAFLHKECGRDAGCAVKRIEESAGSLRFKLSGPCRGGGPKEYGELFRIVGESKDALKLTDFSISQGTLEQTFNRIAAEDLLRLGIDDDEETNASPQLGNVDQEIAAK
jgi:ATP-binding cassette subfamily A (ABC1) protein 1